MKRKTLISIAVIMIMLLNCITPLFSAYATESNGAVTFNSELYNALYEALTASEKTGFTYNPVLRTISGNFSSVEELDLHGSKIDDLTGLEHFSGLKKLDISGNLLTLDSNLEVINSMTRLKELDLSTNQIDGFSWLTLENLNVKNCQSQEIMNVELVDLGNVENKFDWDTVGTPVKADFKNDVAIQETKGLLSEINLESLAVDVKTYLSDGAVWNAEGTTAGIQENKSRVDTSIIDYERNSVILHEIYKYSACKGLNNTLKMYNVSVNITDSRNQYYGSNIETYYILFDENYEGIQFRDENFYKSMKKQQDVMSIYNEIKNTYQFTSDNNYNIEIFDSLKTSSLTPEWFCESELVTASLKNEITTQNGIYNTPNSFANGLTNLMRDFLNGTETQTTVAMTTSDSTQKIWVYKYEVIDNTTAYLSYYIYKIKPMHIKYFDKALTMVIEKNELYNDLNLIVSTNEKIKDLTGLEKLVGLNSKLVLNYNYIDSIDRIIELEENKEKVEQEIRDKVSELIGKFTSDTPGYNEEKTYNYQQMLKDYIDKIEELTNSETELSGKLLEAQNNYDSNPTDENKTKRDDLDNQLKEKRKEINKLTSDKNIAMEKCQKIMNEISETWKRTSYLLANYRTPELDKVYRDNEKIENSEQAFELLISQMNKLKDLESKDALSEAESRLLLEKIDNLTSAELDATKGDDGKYITNYMSLYEDKIESIRESGKTNIEKILWALKSEKTNSLTMTYTDAEVLYRVITTIIENNNPEMINQIIKLPRLKTLNLHYNMIESIEGIENLKELENLYISDNLLTDIDDVNWEELTKMKELNLSKNQISSIDCLSPLAKLQFLDVSNCLLGGKFEFDFIQYYPVLNTIIFDGNYYNDLSFLMQEYAGKAKKFEDITTFAEYIRTKVKKDKNGNYSGIDFSFKNQKITMDYGTVDVRNGAPVILSLPSIFKDIEEMDPYNTTFGIEPGDGSVDELGKKVSFATYSNGNNVGIVRIESLEAGIPNRDWYSVGAGTTCTIKFNIGGEVTNPSNPSNPSNPNDDPTTPPSENPGSIDKGNVEITRNDIEVSSVTDDEKFVFVTKPNAKVSSLVSSLKALGYTVNSVGDIENPEEDNSKVYTSLTVSLTTRDGDNELTSDAYEVVVYGDVDGDGDVDSIDSGYARALRYDRLYDDIQDSAERSELMEAFRQTSNFKAADSNKTGAIEKEDTRKILFYRAGLIDSFNV